MFGISQKKIRNLPPGYFTGACFFDDQAKTVTAWLGSSDSPAIFTKHCTLRFPFIWSLQNSLNGKRFQSLEDYKRHLEQKKKDFFAQKRLKSLGKMRL